MFFICVRHSAFFQVGCGKYLSISSAFQHHHLGICLQHIFVCLEICITIENDSVLVRAFVGCNVSYIFNIPYIHTLAARCGFRMRLVIMNFMFVFADRLEIYCKPYAPNSISNSRTKEPTTTTMKNRRKKKRQDNIEIVFETRP